MNARRIAVAALVVSLFVFGVGVAAAQTGNGYGPGTGTCQQTGEPCPMNPMQAQMGGQFGMGAQNGMQGNTAAPNQNRMGGQQRGPASQNQMGGRWNTNTAPATANTSALSADAVAAMIAGWQDEASAYAAYGALIEQFGEIVPFVQLQNAEAQHMAAWERQFARYGLALPEAPIAEELPMFATPQDACAAAEAIEEANIGLYDELQAAFEGYPSLTRVVTALRAASLNRHLPELELCAAS